jgi:hypothetical protein
MKILTRYIFKEMLGPTALGFAFYTFIILMKNLFDFAGMIIKRSLPASTVGRLLFLSLPHIVVLTVPMSLLFGILIAVGRLSSDSEIIAMRASASPRAPSTGRSSFSASLVSDQPLSDELRPAAGNAKFAALPRSSRPRSKSSAAVFYDEYENLTIVNDVDPKTLQWKGVFVADSRTAARRGPTARPGDDRPAAQGAQGGRAALRPSCRSARQQNHRRGERQPIDPQTSNQVWLNLKTAETHLWDQSRIVTT